MLVLGLSTGDGSPRHSSYVECRIVAGPLATGRGRVGTGSVRVRVSVRVRGPTVRVRGPRVGAFAAHSGSCIEFLQGTTPACWVYKQHRDAWLFCVVASFGCLLWWFGRCVSGCG